MHCPPAAKWFSHSAVAMSRRVHTHALKTGLQQNSGANQQDSMRDPTGERSRNITDPTKQHDKQTSTEQRGASFRMTCSRIAHQHCLNPDLIALPRALTLPINPCICSRLGCTSQMRQSHNDQMKGIRKLDTHTQRHTDTQTQTHTHTHTPARAHTHTTHTYAQKD